MSYPKKCGNGKNRVTVKKSMLKKSAATPVGRTWSSWARWPAAVVPIAVLPFNSMTYQTGQQIPVDGMMPFLVTHKSAQESLKQWVDSLWFAPNKFKQGANGKFGEVYLPLLDIRFTHLYLLYSGQRCENYTNTIGTGKNKRTVTRTRWYLATRISQDPRSGIRIIDTSRPFHEQFPPLCVAQISTSG